MDTAEDNISQCSDESLVLIRINIPDLGVQKCMQFHRDELVWDVKQQVLAALPKEMKESFNYGLYCPPSNGKAGKFLDEERPLFDYPFPGPVGYLELKYKRRVYKLMNVDEKQIKQLHTKANLRRLLDFVTGGQAEKISKLCAKGLDPNFHCHDTGETPLSLAAVQKKCNRVILALANGGALLDFRTRDGTTALHRAVEKNNLEGIKTLLDLGASPNYKDNKGLTALYSCVLNNADAHICELLLHDHAAIGAADLQGWQEVHQACRNGLVQHLEHLLFYGADMNARNASGNTPLHVCAVNEQESCARVLLFRGADKDALNFANQTPYQVAVIAGNLALAEVINSHTAEEVVPFREPPKYNPRRRASIASAAALNRTHSDPRLEITLGIKPPSPSPSNRSLPPFSSASSLSETSTGSSSTCTQPSNDDSEDTASVSVITEKSITSESSGMCGSITCAAGGYDSYPERPAPLEGPLAPGLMCVCLENYSSDIQGHLQLSQGDIIEVTGSADFGLLEGILRHQQGLFPAACVQEVRLRHPEARFAARRVEGRREASVKQQQLNSLQAMESKSFRIGEPRTVALHKGKKGFGFVLRGAKATSPLMELMPSDNCPALQYLDDVDKGGVADLSGLKKGDFLLTINGEDVSQASHEHVVNLIRKSGELVSMTVVTVQRASTVAFAERPQSISGRQCATLPRKLMRGKAAPAPPRRDPRTTLSVGRARARSMVAGLAEIEALDRTLMEYDSEGRSTKSSSIESLPNKQQQLHSTDCLPHKAAAASQQQQQQQRSRTSSVKRAAELQEMFAHRRDPRNNRNHLSKNNAHVLRSPKVYGSVAEMKRSRQSNNNNQNSNNNNNVARPPRPEDEATNGPARMHKVFHSTPDLNESELMPDEEGGGRPADPRRDPSRRSHSQEDVAVIQLNGRNVRLTWERPSPRRIEDDDKRGSPWQSIEEIYNRIPVDCEEPPRRTLSEAGAGHPPPPTHPPPPPPVGQVVRVDVSRSRGSEYAKVSNAAAVAAAPPPQQPVPDLPPAKPSVMSSFRPGDSAKLYASPQEIGIVGYRAAPPPQPPRPAAAAAGLPSHKPVSCASIRSRSLPPNVPPPPKTSGSSPSSSASSETETSSDSAGYACSTFKKSYQQQQQRATDAVSTDSGNSSERASLASSAAFPANPYAQPVAVVAAMPQFHHQTAAAVQMARDEEPYIPEPDYDVSDEEEDETPAEPESASRPGPPRHPPPPPPQVQTVTLTSFQSPGVQREWAPENAPPLPPPGTERKKLPPTPPSKRREAAPANGGRVVGLVGELVQRTAVPKMSSPVGSPAASFREPTPPATKEKPPKQRAKESPTGETCQKSGRSGNGFEAAREQPPPVLGKPPPAVAGKSAKTAAPAAAAAETAEIADFKEIIARKAAERLRRASYTAADPVSPAGESPKREFAADTPGEPAKEAAVVPLPQPPPPSPPPEVAAHPPEDDIAINVKETISAFEKAFEKKSEAVKSTSPSVARSAPKKPAAEEPLPPPQRKPVLLKGSHSQVFEAAAAKAGTMKPSRSCPHDLAQEGPGPGPAPAQVRDRGQDSDEDSDDATDGAWNLKAKITEETDAAALRDELELSIGSRRVLAKSVVVSLAKLPPPIESGETDAESSDVTEPTSPSNARTAAGSFDSSLNGSAPSSPEGPAPAAPVHQAQRQDSDARVPAAKKAAREEPRTTAAAAAAEEEKIQQSMDLIKIHASSLQEVNSLAGLVVPPPPGFDERNNNGGGSQPAEDLSMIAPPPEFSDDVHVPVRAAASLSPLSDMDLEEAEVAAKSAAAALAAAAGGLHLSCPSFAAAKMAPRAPQKQPQQQQHYHPPTTMKSARQMVRPSNGGGQPQQPPAAATAKVRLLPPGHAYGGPAACNGVLGPAEPARCYGEPAGKAKTQQLPQPQPPKEFRTKAMSQWSTRDVSDWLESLFLPEYKARFEAAGVDGRRLSYLDTNLLSELGVKRVGHRMNMERSLRRHSMMKQ